MKKLFLLLATISLLCFSSVALAATNGQLLTKEETIASQTMSALTGNVSYDAVSQNFTPELMKVLDQAKLTEMKKEVKTKFGKMQEMNLANLQKRGQTDRVTYLASFAKQKLVRVDFIFDVSTETPKVTSFALVPVEVKQPAQESQVPPKPQK